MSNQVSELSSSGSGNGVTGSTVPGTDAAPVTAEPTPKPRKSSRSDADSFLPTVPDVLALLQDDVHLLSKMLQVEIVPRLHPHDACAVVIYGVTIQNGKFTLLAKEKEQE